jgi:hypothetical protein
LIIPYRTYGVNLSQRVDNTAALTLSMDTSGNLIFNDDYVTNVLDMPNGISLKELYTRVQGVYSDSSGQLIFNDSTLSRPYTLSEIVNAGSSWQNNLLTGALWWIGSTSTNHAACANIPASTTPNSTTLVLWSIDRFFYNLLQNNAYSVCNSDEIISGDLFVNQLNGDWIWYDIPSLAIVLPPIPDQYKITQIIAKLAFVAYNSSEPIVFRLWDDTNNIELTRAAVVQCNPCEVSYPVVLSWQGQLQTPSDCTLNEACGCIDISCTTGDPSCATTDNSSQVVQVQYTPGSRVIRVQFHVSNYQDDNWSRVFGMQVDGNYVAQSTLECIIFDSSPTATYGKQNGTVAFTSQNSVVVTFTNPLPSSNYAISLSCSQNINTWWSAKSNVGFTINSELSFTGSVDWTTTNLNPTTTTG